jgi:hypothetical protein
MRDTAENQDHLMSRLPLHIVDLIRQKQLPRITLQGGLEENEKNLDKLVINHRDILGELLIDNEFLDDAMGLKVLAQQFLKTDVLFAAVDEDDNPERLVIVENRQEGLKLWSQIDSNFRVTYSNYNKSGEGGFVPSPG